MLARNDDDNRIIGRAIDIDLGRHAMALAKQEWGPHALEPIGPYLTALLPLKPESDLQRRWHIVQVEPQQEAEVEEALKDIKLDAWCPREPKKVLVRGHYYRTVNKPMLPGYVFAGFDASVEAWQLIRRTQIVHGERIEGMRGVIRLLMIDLRPVPLGERELERIRNWETEGGIPRKHPRIPLAVNDMVRVVSGPFYGFLGLVAETDERKQEVAVDLDIFARKTRVRLEADQVERV